MPKMYINGELVDARSGKTMDVKNPSTGAVVDSVPRGSVADVDAAVETAAKAFPAGAAMPPTQRAAILPAAAGEMKGAGPGGPKLLSPAQGKTLRPAILPDP